MRKVVRYYANDGSECESRETAEAFDRAIATADKAREWMSAEGISERKVAEYHRVILRWEKEKELVALQTAAADQTEGASNEQ